MNRKTRPSAKPSRSAKSAKSKEPANTTEPNPVQEVPPKDQLVKVHDLVGTCVFVVPPQLKQIIGEEAYELQMKDTEVHEVLFIVRQPTDIVYIRCPIVVLPAEREKSTAPAA